MMLWFRSSKSDSNDSTKLKKEGKKGNVQTQCCVRSWSDQEATLYPLLCALPALPSSLCPPCPLPDFLHHGKICRNSRLHVLPPQCLEEVATSPSLSHVWVGVFVLESPHPSTYVCWGEGGCSQAPAETDHCDKSKGLADWQWGLFPGPEGKASPTYFTHHNH